MKISTVPRDPAHPGPAESALAAMAVTLACVLAVDFMEHANPLRWARQATWEYLAGTFDGDASKVVVVDITPIWRPLDEEGRAVTDRATLRALLEAIRAEGPAAIGLDIDLSPEDGRYVDPADAELLAWLAGLRRKHDGRHIDVRVGVQRTCAEEPADWLGAPELAGLAATVVADMSDNRTMPISVSFRPGVLLPALGADAAKACVERDGLPEPAWSDRLASPYLEHDVGGVALRSFFVDFSTLPDLIDRRLPKAGRERLLLADELVPILAAELRADPLLVQDKLVLVGFANPSHMSDNGFAPPSRVRAVPGLYAHAAAAATLLGGGWIYMPSPLLEKLLDLGLAAALIALVAFIRAKLLGRWTDAEEVSAHILLTAGIVSLLWLGIGPVLARHLRIIADGLPIVTLALFAEVLWGPLVVVYHAIRARPGAEYPA